VPDFAQTFGADVPDTIGCRHRLAVEVSEAGDRRRAEDLLAGLIPDATRVLGADHTPATFDVRYDHARLAATPVEQTSRFDQLGVDQVRLIGADDPRTLATRRMQVASVANGQQHAEAYRLARDRVTDHARVLGPNHDDTRFMREILVEKAWASGLLHEAITLLRALVGDQRRVVGPDHPETVRLVELLRSYERRHP
jgi:hypothetical protein